MNDLDTIETALGKAIGAVPTCVRRPLLDPRDAVTYEDYHEFSMRAGDVDPSYSMLRYLCERFELNPEQRMWLAFLYSTTYCGASVFYIYNEFPDFETLDTGRLERWWTENKRRVLFQTDRRRIQTADKWVETVESYRELCRDAGTSQTGLMWSIECGFPEVTYDEAWKLFGRIRNVGRFSLFLLLEAIHVVTGANMRPLTLDVRHANSCRNGLAEAIRRPDLNNHESKRKLSREEMAELQDAFGGIRDTLQDRDPRNNVWNIETTLCAYKKYLRGDRYVGYYLDRQADEIARMEKAATSGVDWSVLWDYREETFGQDWLKEQWGWKPFHEREPEHLATSA